jgi:putative transposase
MDEQMPQELTLAALDMAIKRRRPLPGLMHHSDRGSQGGFKWSSQHPDKGGCDEEAEAAFGSIWAGSSAVTWPAPRGAT